MGPYEESNIPIDIGDRSDVTQLLREVHQSVTSHEADIKLYHRNFWTQGK